MDSKKRKKCMFIGAIILLIAGLADIKYKGLFYKQLPKNIQKNLDCMVDTLNK